MDAKVGGKKNGRHGYKWDYNLLRRLSKVTSISHQTIQNNVILLIDKLEGM